MNEEFNRSTGANGQSGGNQQSHPTHAARVDLESMGITEEDIEDAILWARSVADDPTNGT
jgi:hypothetical protein